METNVTLTQNEFNKLKIKFAYRYIIDFDDFDAFGSECTVFVEPFLQLIKHKSKTIRKVSIKVLAEARHKEAVKLLIEALNDESKSVKQDAAYYLGQLGDRSALKPLLFATNDPTVYTHAILAIRELLGWDLEAEMVKAVSDPDSKIRYSAVWVMANFLMVSESTTALIKVLKSKKPKIRLGAITALGKGDSICACEALIESLKKPVVPQSLNECNEKIIAIKQLKTKLENALEVVAEYSKAHSLQEVPL